jgi:hypothetical protein
MAIADNLWNIKDKSIRKGKVVKITGLILKLLLL